MRQPGSSDRVRQAIDRARSLDGILSALSSSRTENGRSQRTLAGSASEGRATAPHLMPVEAANILRRAQLAGDISADIASIAHRDLLDLHVELFPYEPFAARTWALRDNVSCYDAWYIALAEMLGAPLATLDGRLAMAPGPRCRFMTPPAVPG
jgi:predicted nucleic acid-binding protein